MTSQTRTTKSVEKAEEHSTPVWEVPGYKALTEEEMRRDLAEADIYSKAFALIPYQMRGNAGDMYLLMQIAKHLNVPFVTALRGLSFIGDKDVKPAMSAQLMSALVRNAGHTLREQWDPETNTATAVIIRKDDPSFEHVAVWDEEKARIAGLWESTPTWIQYPKAMLTARAMSEVCRHAASEVLLGFSYVPEEFHSAESASRVLDMRQQAKSDMDRLRLSSEKVAEVLDGVTLPGITIALMTPRELEEINARIGVIEYERDKDKIDEVRERIAYVPQRGSVHWDFPTTVFDVVLMGRYAHLGLVHRPGKEDRALAMEALDKMKMADFADRQISELSGGQKQRVFIARALAQDAQLYIMDEPLAGVDETTERIIMDKFMDLQKEKRTVIAVHHDLSTLDAYFDYLVVLNRTVKASDYLADIDKEAALARAYRVKE